MKELRIVGRPQRRTDAERKVLGQAMYVGDLHRERLAHGVVLRSPHHYAQIVAIMAQHAKALPGILAVLTAADIPGRNGFGVLVADQPVLASDVTRFQGEAVALVVAESESLARRALDLIEVTYDPLPAVLDPEVALAIDAPLLHPDGNLLANRRIHAGDIEKGMATAEVILEETFETPFIDHAYLEPEATLVEWQEDGALTVWASSQHPYRDRAQIAASLCLPEEKVRVINASIGGAFGGKDDITLQILAALGALVTHRPVRMVNTREESMLSHSKRHAVRMRYELGAMRDGRLTALRAQMYCDTGAYASFGPAVGGVMTELAAGPYRIPNLAIDTYIAYTNNPVGGAMRGFGGCQVNFAMESCMDMLAERLGCDGIDLRLKNVWQKGERLPTGVTLSEEVPLAISLRKAREARDRLRQSEGSDPSKAYGVGVASSVLSIGYGFRIPDSSATQVEWLPQGGALIHLATPDLGQGLETVAAQFAAEALDLPFEGVAITRPDTSAAPDSGASNASRMTYMIGNSLLLSAKQARALLLGEASKVLDVPLEELVYRHGVVHTKGDPRRHISSSELAALAAKEGRNIVGEGVFSFPCPEDLPTEFGPGIPHTVFCYGAQVAAIEVDRALGIAKVKNVVAIHDVGRVINPPAAAGQIEGAVTMGVGYALYEEFCRRDNSEWADTFSEYLLPTAMDTPHIETIFIEYPEASGPFGAKGTGEQGTVPTASAIANAIADATGVRVTRIPIRPEDLITSPPLLE